MFHYLEGGVGPVDGELAVADPFNHRVVIGGIRQNYTAGQARGERTQRRPIWDVARGEQECGLLAVQISRLALQQQVGRLNSQAPSAPAGGRSARCTGRLDQRRPICSPRP
jgi:hypothetical protein